MNPLELYLIAAAAIVVFAGVCTLIWAAGSDKEPTYRIREVWKKHYYYDIYNWVFRIERKKGLRWKQICSDHTDKKYAESALRIYIAEKAIEDKTPDVVYFKRSGEEHTIG